MLLGRVGTYKGGELSKAGADKVVHSFKEVYDIIKNLKGRTYLISDWDGTILDSINPRYGHKTKSAPEAFNNALNINENQKNTVLNEYIRTSGIPFKIQVKMILKKLGLKVSLKTEKKILNMYMKVVRANAYKAKTFKDAVWLNKIVKIATFIISSSTTHNYLQKEVKEKIKIKPKLILGAKGEFHKGLPHFNYILKKLGLHDNLIIISDTVADMKEWRKVLKTL